MTRKFTNAILTLIDEGVLNPENVLQACLTYMSEDEVRDMVLVNDLIDEEYLEEI